jgi:hypothetical protein
MVNAINRPQQLGTIKRRYNIGFITYAIMTELDCPTCHQRYMIPEEMKNHVEQVHQLNKAYMDWIFLLEDRISQLEATSMASH